MTIEQILAAVDRIASEPIAHERKWMADGLRDLIGNKPPQVEAPDVLDAARYRFIREQMTKTSPISYYSIPHSLTFLRGVTGPKVFDQEVDARINGAAFETPAKAGEQPITPERGGLSSEGTGQLDDQGNRATEETGNDRPAAPVYSMGTPCPVCASGRIGQSGYNYRCANCGWLGPRVEWAPSVNGPVHNNVTGDSK